MRVLRNMKNPQKWLQKSTKMAPKIHQNLSQIRLLGGSWGGHVASFFLFPFFFPFSPLWAASWSEVGRQVRPELGQVGSKLGQVGAKMRHVGAKLAQVGAKVAQVGVKLARVGQNLAKMVQLDAKDVHKVAKDGQRCSQDPP